ncbi:post-transcriptional regulator [Peribacillus butanolivorans]|uniref:post-transcriptional regulator n=1 Tax=Peribacillus butanolivorans TaxID=421767 RepID=UPI00366F506A
MTKKNHPYQRYYVKVRPFLKSKREEFQMVGLNAVTEEDIWATLTKNKWKRPQENIHLHELVADIVTFSSNQFMTFQMVEAYKSPNLFEPLSEEELKELFKE